MKPLKTVEETAQDIFILVNNWRDTLEKHGMSGGTHSGAPNERVVIAEITAKLSEHFNGEGE